MTMVPSPTLARPDAVNAPAKGLVAQLVHSRRWRNPVGVTGAVIILIIIAMTIFAPLIAPYDPADQASKRLLAPSWAHLMGTDDLGRDTFSRIIYGSRPTLQVGVIAVAIAFIVGTSLGVLAAYRPGVASTLVMRSTDIMLAFPGLILAIVIAGLLGPSARNAMIAIGIMYIPGFTRVVYGTTLAIMVEPYLESGRVLGVPDWLIMARYIFPNILAPLTVLTTISLSTAILNAAALSFLGLGAQPPAPAWGGMLNIARSYMGISPWLAIFPGLAIMIAVLGFNFLGDGLRDILDPRMRTL
jgi:peptide/nickel transport system permease protein